MLTHAELGLKIAEYLAGKWQQPVLLIHLEKIFGGASRETYRIELKVSGEPRSVIVRRDPATSLIDTERELEYRAYEAVCATDIPVPEPLFLENDPHVLERPFSVMQAVNGCETDAGILNAEQKQQIGSQKYELLGRLVNKDPIALGFHRFMTVPELNHCAERELDYWEHVIDTDEIHPQPIVRAAVRWLRRNMPTPPTKLAIVHGDFRTGNFLFKPASGIKAVLDWEMCHLGDPLEDLAWSFDPLWNWGEPGYAGRLITHDKAIALWEKSSGLKVNLQAFRWWRIFAAVKGIAIWISSSEDFKNGQSKDSILAMAGWLMTDRQNQILLDYLSPHSSHQLSGITQ